MGWRIFRQVILACAITAAWPLGVATPARADDPAYLILGAGSIGNIVADRKSAGLFSFEYRAGPELELLHVRPSLGVFATTDSSVYAWLGLNLDLYFAKRIVLTPQLAVGYYSKGDGQDLGHELEFRTGAVLAWRFDDRSRLGLGFHHLSNLGLGKINPGTESLTVFYAHPLGRLIQ